MNNLYKLVLAIALLLGLSNTIIAQKSGSTKYKCMVQMTNYPGEGAYIAVSIIDPKGEYDKTLYVMGADKKWYPDLKEWHKFYKKKALNVSAISGASVSGGDRSVIVLDIENAKINSGYVLRFESAVENQEYHITDLEVPLTSENVNGKIEGTHYIRYVRLSPNQP